MHEALLMGKTAASAASYPELIPDTDFITASALATAMGVTEGTVINDTGNVWMKFLDNGKTLYIPKKGIRADISFNHLYAKGLVYGLNSNGVTPLTPNVNQYRTVVIGGRTFIVRLMKGADVDPSNATYNSDNPNFTTNSEYTRLFQRCWSGFPYGTPYLNYSTADLGVTDAAGTTYYATWCQEAHYVSLPTTRVYRGLTTPAWFAATSGDFKVSGVYHMVWRPVLELVP